MFWHSTSAATNVFHCWFNLHFWFEIRQISMCWIASGFHNFHRFILTLHSIEFCKEKCIQHRLQYYSLILVTRFHFLKAWSASGWDEVKGFWKNFSFIVMFSLWCWNFIWFYCFLVEINSWIHFWGFVNFDKNKMYLKRSKGKKSSPKTDSFENFRIQHKRLTILLLWAFISSKK